MTFGVGFLISSANLLLRDWLRSAGVDPDRDVRIVVVPPGQMIRHLSAGTIDGYYAGEPWNTVAVQAGAAWSPLTSATQQPGHLETALITSSAFSARNATEHSALVASLIEAGAWCGDPANREHLTKMLGQPQFLNLPAAVVGPSLTGKFDGGKGRVENGPGFHLFTGGDNNTPTLARATAMQRALAGAGLIPATLAADAGLPGNLFREDLYQQAVASIPIRAEQKAERSAAARPPTAKEQATAPAVSSGMPADPR